MFGEKDRALKLVDEEATTVLEKEAEFEGKLTFAGKVQIKGKFRGEVFSDGTLLIGEGGDVSGTIDVDTLIVQGTVLGNIKAKSRIEMHPPAIVKGDITAPSLVITEGVLFEGNCSMNQLQKVQVLEFS